MQLDSNDVNEKNLIEFGKEAGRIGEAHLKATRETECENVRLIWDDKTIRGKKGKARKNSRLGIRMAPRLLELPPGMEK